MAINIEFDIVRARSVIAIPVIGTMVYLLGVTDPTVILAGLGAIVACVKLDQPTEQEL